MHVQSELADYESDMAAGPVEISRLTGIGSGKGRRDPLVVQVRPLAVDPAAALRPLADDPADGACQADKVIASKAEAETLAREARLSDICATELELESMVGLSAALVKKIGQECAELRARDGFAARVWRSP